MKHAFAAILALGLGLGASAVQAQSCTTCTAVIMRDATVAHLPLLGWMQTTGSPTFSLEVAPSYGTWNNSAQTYTPGADFWNVGIDQMTIEVNTNDFRTLVLLVAQPTEETQQVNNTLPLTYSGGAGGATGYATVSLAPRGNQPGIAVLKGLTTTSIGPPGISTGRTKMFTINNIAEIEKIHGADWSLVANVLHSGLECDDITVPCSTDPIVLDNDSEQLFSIELTVGHDVLLGVSTAEKFVLRLEVCSSYWGGNCEVREIHGLDPIDLTGATDMFSGLVGGDTRNSDHEVISLTAWRVLWSDDDENGMTRFDPFDNSPAAFWDGQGAATDSSADQGYASLQNMVFASVATYRDTLPNDLQRLRVMFDLDTSTLAFDDNDSAVAFTAQSDAAVGGTTKAFDLFVKKVSGTGYFVRARLLDDNGTVHPSDQITIPAGVTKIAMHFFSDVDGFLKVRVGSTYKEVAAKDNSSRLIDNYSIGATQPTLGQNNVARSMRFDNVTTRFADP